MIFIRILGLRISPVKSLLTTSANSLSMLMSNRCIIKDAYNDRRLQFNFLRDYGTDERKQLTEDVRVRWKPTDLPDPELWERRRREHATEQFILGAIDVLGSLYLMTSEFQCANYLPIEMWETKEFCYRYWLAIFEQTDRPLVVKLKEKLQNSGVSTEDFCRAIVDVYFSLKNSHCNTLPCVEVTPSDVVRAADRLNFSRTQCECLKILFSLNDIYNIRI